MQEASAGKGEAEKSAAQQGIQPTPGPAVGAAEESGRQVQLLRILDQLDAAAEQDPMRRARRSPRVPFRREEVAIHLYHPGGSVTNPRVCTRDLSASGISLVHNAFIHPNTRVDIRLSHAVGDMEDIVRGRVVRSEHVGGAWHHIGVVFDRPITPERYLEAAQIRLLHDRSTHTHLYSTILYLDALDVQCELFSHYLRQTGAKVVGCTDVAGARERLAAETFDLVVTEASVPIAAGDYRRLDVVRIADSLRDAGHAGPIALCTADPWDDHLKERCTSAGLATGVLRKPFDSGRCLEAVKAWLEGDGVSSGPIYSPLASEPELASVLEHYVSHSHALARSLLNAVRRRDLEQCRALCLQAHSSGGSFGFPELSAAAADALQLLDRERSVQGALSALMRLRGLCAAVVAEQRPDVPQHPADPADTPTGQLAPAA